MNNDDTKLRELADVLTDLNSVAVAFSAGVDSTFLAAAAQRILGDKAVAVTAVSPSSTEAEVQEARDLAALIGIRHVTLSSTEFDNPDFTANTHLRCYYCKKERFAYLADWAQSEGYAFVVEGTNADDLSDYRPGLQAIAELDKVKSPLLACGFTKADIRRVSRDWGLPTWDKPSAACLVSRLAYGLPITTAALKQIEASELVVRRYIPGQIRVRHHGDVARIEAEPAYLHDLICPETAGAIAAALKDMGFTYVTVDLTGYRTGSMNDSMKEAARLEG